MGRLIDADALTKKLNEFCGNQRYLIPEQVWKIVKTQPTAYDLEKVVEEVKDYRDLVTGCYLREIIEIVRKGGVE